MQAIHVHAPCRRAHITPLTSFCALTAQPAKPLALKATLYHKSAHGKSFSSHRHGRCSTRRRSTTCSATSTAIGVGIFFTPSIVAVIYAYFKGKGNIKDGLSRLLTEVTQGYFQPNVGGESIPVAQGELSDLAGDEPLFKALYQWCAHMPHCQLPVHVHLVNSCNCILLLLLHAHLAHELELGDFHAISHLPLFLPAGCSSDLVCASISVAFHIAA